MGLGKSRGSKHLPRFRIFVASLCLAAAPAQAQFTGSLREMAETPVVSVRASESLKAKPDTARVDVGVQSYASTATDALADNAVKMERLIATLKRAGIPAARIQTNNVQLHPRYDGTPNPPRLEGYYARNSVRVSTKDLAGLGKLLDTVAAPGSVTIHGPYFSLEDDEDLQRTARRAALARADAEAEFVAKNRGFSSARVISVDTDSSGRSSDIVVIGSRIPDPSTPIETGEVNVGASVTVRYILIR